MKMLPATLLILCVLSTLPGLLLLRQQQLARQATGVALLLLATTSGYIGSRLLLTPHTAPAVRFVLKPADGHFQVIRPEQLPTALATARGRPVMLEFYASWCSSCVAWKKNVFSRTDVQQAMTPLVLLQIDASELTPPVQSLLDHYGLPGLPAILVFDRKGTEVTELRLLGEMPAEEFKSWIGTRLTSRL